MSDPCETDFRDVPDDQLAAANALCDRFESAWRSGIRPALASFTEDADGLSTDSVLRLLIPLDIDYRRLAGENPVAADYLAQFPTAGLAWLSSAPVSGLPPPASSLRPQALGDYQLQEQLGSGGMGVVYKAWHARMRRHVAIKVVHESLAGQSDLAQRFAREVVAAAQLSHPNIVRAYDAGEHEGKLYLVTEYIEGADLARRVKQHGPCGVRQAVDYAIQAARGLEYAHAHGITHRDIKPSNLLLDAHGTIKILDLGLARLEDAAPLAERADDMLTTSRAILGTVDYMAPEQAIDPRAADARSDIYSLGCTLYYLLTGRSCYDGATFFERLLAHREQPLPSLATGMPNVPPALDGVLHRMIAKRPDERYARITDLITDLSTLAKILPADETRLSHSVAGASHWPLAAVSESRWQRTAPNLSQNATLVESDRRSVHSGHGKAKFLWGSIAVAAIAALAYSATRRPLADQPPDEKPPQPPPMAVVPFSADDARAHQRRWAEHLVTPVQIEHPSGVRLVLVPPGRFTMGTDPDQLRELVKSRPTAEEVELLASESPPHDVEITRPYYLAATEVTVGQFRRFVDATGYRSEAEKPGAKAWGWTDKGWIVGSGYNWKDRGEIPTTDAHPAVNLTWNDAVAYCEWLTKSSGGAATYRLPTEAEWEFACRAGTDEAWHSVTESALPEYAWLVFNSNQRPHPVGRKRPNALGLYDMHGNTKEWCADRYQADYYAVSPRRDPTGPLRGVNRVIRGGRAPNAPWLARSSMRHRAHPTSTFEGGFRVARDL